jgi:hypothetical protein
VCRDVGLLLLRRLVAPASGLEPSSSVDALLLRDLPFAFSCWVPSAWWLGLLMPWSSLDYGLTFPLRSVFAEAVEVDRGPRRQDEIPDPMSQAAGDQIAYGSLDVIAFLELH